MILHDRRGNQEDDRENAREDPRTDQDSIVIDVRQGRIAVKRHLLDNLSFACGL